jgi:hypothetical protein
MWISFIYIFFFVRNITDNATSLYIYFNTCE